MTHKDSESPLVFPMAFPIKVMGRRVDGFAQTIVAVVQEHAPDFDAATLEIRASRAGNYLSVTATINATSREQLDNLYRALSSHPLVKVVLQADCLRTQVPPIEIRVLGRVEYVPTWQAMREFTAQRTSDTADELWIVEHPPVFTLGQGGRREHLLDPGEIAVVATDRGGQITYHGPGQVVIYTLIDLRRLGIFVKELVYRIEQSVIQTLAEFGATARRVRGAPGVYVPFSASLGAAEFAGLAKIAALGIKVSQGRSYHGVALNVAMDLTPFSRINPCGYEGLVTVDLATLGISLTWRAAADRLSERLALHFTP